ncbi:MAG: hypothetical protein U0821_14250 [Chloroflexota bacterium]
MIPKNQPPDAVTEANGVLAVDASASNPDASDDAATPRPAPLVVSGLVITKRHLLDVLRGYVPHAVDVSEIEGERFVVTVQTDG